MDGYGGSISWMEFLHDAVGNHMDYMAGSRRTVRSDSGYLQGSQSISGIKEIHVLRRAAVQMVLRKDHLYSFFSFSATKYYGIVTYI